MLYSFQCHHSLLASSIQAKMYRLGYIGIVKVYCSLQSRQFLFTLARMIDTAKYYTLIIKEK